MRFDYFYQEQPTEDLDIEDIGNVCIVANDEAGQEYYLMFKTDLGLTQNIYYGPAEPDVESLPFEISYTYKRFEFNENKIGKMIDKFLNSNGIVQARIVDSYEEINDNIRSFIEYVYCNDFEG